MLLSPFFSYENANTKKEALTVELSFKSWHVWLLHNIFLLRYALKIPLLDDLLNYGTNTMVQNGTLSPSNGLVFNIAQ
jgi:hypothetical protein